MDQWQSCQHCHQSELAKLATKQEVFLWNQTLSMDFKKPDFKKPD